MTLARDPSGKPKELQVDADGNLKVTSDATQIGTKVTAVTALGAGGTGLIGWLSTIANFVKGLPTSLGVAASAASTPVVLASDDAQVGTKVTAVTALGAGGTGLIGWLSTIANFVKGLPTALGGAATAASVPVTLASDDAQVGTKVTAVTALGAGGTGIIGWLSTIAGSLTTLLTSFAAPSNASSAAYATNLVIKAAPGTLKRLNGFNSKASAQWIQLHNAAALPADATAPVLPMYVGPLQNFSFDFGTEGRTFSVGIVVCNSSTGPTKTIGAADCWFDAQYL